MDLVRELKDVRFELSLRGYDCEAVDAFLARLRTDIATLQDAHEASAARISELEAAAQDGGGSSETEGTLRRTLLLAQRLADETEAEAKSAAAEMIASATAEAEQLRASAEIESRSMREEGQRELSNARDEAASIRETSGEEAARARAESRENSERVLAEAERRGMQRVAELEQAAQVEVSGMRESIRSEVRELEAARARVMADISALETHLEQQRVRVRNAVEALRVGMSGSIEDLERVAEDDDLLATHPAPQISGASADAVAVASDIAIVESVSAHAPPAPTVDDVEAAAATATEETDDVAPSDAGEGPIDADETPIEVVEDSIEVDFVEADLVDADVDDGFESEAVAVAEVVVEDFEAEVVAEDAGPATEAIPLVDAAESVVEDVSAGWVDHSDTELIELDQEPTALFGTDLAVDAETTEVASASDEVSSEGGAEASGAEPEPQTTFVDRFSELLDSLPVLRDDETRTLN